MSVKSRRAAGPLLLGAAQTAIYTVPAGRTFRGQLHLANYGAGVSVAYIFINGAVWYVGGMPAAASLQAHAEIVLNPGDVLTGQVTALLVTATLSGSLLVGAPV